MDERHLDKLLAHGESVPASGDRIGWDRSLVKRLAYHLTLALAHTRAKALC